MTKAIKKYMIPVYGLQVVMGNRCLDKSDEKDGVRAIPKRYVPYVMEWLEKRAEDRDE